MITSMMLVAALLPVAVLLFYIYRKDSICPEPAGQLVKAFAMGLLAVPLSFCVSFPFEAIGLYRSEAENIADSIRLSFFGAAIPEETAKLLILWLLLRRNKYFDEKMDGIVYSVCVSLGFAALENVLYLVSYYENWLGVGISRALFAIPGHFCFGVLMGYYYSLARFNPESSLKNKVMILLAPVIAHGMYDSIVFITEITPALSGILTIIFLFFCHKLWKYCSKNIFKMIEHQNKSYL